LSAFHAAVRPARLWAKSTAPEHEDRENHQNDTADNSSEEEEVFLNLVLKPFDSAFSVAHDYKLILAKLSSRSGCVL